MSIDKIHNLYKPVGFTPLGLINHYKMLHPNRKGERMGYAGRLDPMADGVLLVLEGGANKSRQKYLKLDKKYDVDILMGVSTDSYDVLGIVENSTSEKAKRADLQKILNDRVGTFEQAYPPFSSKPLKGRPLFYWARKGELARGEIPTAERTIHSSELVKTYSLNSGKMREKMYEKIGKVTGDFRQKAVLSSWEAFFSKNQQTSYEIAKIRVSCSSGTYMRSLAHDVGNELGIPSLAYSITRTAVGTYTIEDSLRIV